MISTVEVLICIPLDCIRISFPVSLSLPPPWMVAILTGMKWDFSISLICIFLLAEVVLLVHFLDICTIISLVLLLIYLLIQLFIILVLNFFFSSLYVLDINSLSDA